MFFIYHGYCSADNYDNSEGPQYLITVCRTVAEVVEFRKKFDEQLPPDNDHVEFRVFEGTEHSLEPVSKVVDWRLK